MMMTRSQAMLYLDKEMSNKRQCPHAKLQVQMALERWSALSTRTSTLMAGELGWFEE